MTGPKLTETMVERAVVRIQERTPASRLIENVLAIAGAAQAALYGTIEALGEAGWRLGPCEAERGFPWVTVIIFVGCVLPKTVGRATAGRLWEVLGNRFGGAK